MSSVDASVEVRVSQWIETPNPRCTGLFSFLKYKTKRVLSDSDQPRVFVLSSVDASVEVRDLFPRLIFVILAIKVKKNAQIKNGKYPI